MLYGFIQAIWISMWCGWLSQWTGFQWHNSEFSNSSMHSTSLRLRFRQAIYQHLTHLLILCTELMTVQTVSISSVRVCHYQPLIFLWDPDSRHLTAYSPTPNLDALCLSVLWVSIYSSLLQLLPFTSICPHHIVNRVPTFTFCNENPVTLVAAQSHLHGYPLHLRQCPQPHASWVLPRVPTIVSQATAIHHGL